MQITANELSLLLNGSIEGNPAVFVNRPSKIEEGGEGTITFLSNPKYESYVYTTTASIILVSKDFVAAKPVQATIIRVENVYESLAFLLEKFGAAIQNQPTREIDKTAFIHDSAVLHDTVSIGKFSIVENEATVGENTIIDSQVFIGKGVSIGKNCRIYPGVKIYYGVKIGDNCIIHSNVVLGSDGFGFAPKKDGTYKKVPQIGNIVIASDVEIGSCSAIDRGSIGSTKIGRGVKIDNMVQIAHNVEIGEHTVIAAQTGIAGSTKIGKHCMIGGQVGFAGHLTVADGSKIQARSGVASNIKEPNKAWFGYPAIGYINFIKSYGVFKKLPELYRKIGKLEKKLNSDE